jgi:hypothetical protein
LNVSYDATIVGFQVRTTKRLSKAVLRYSISCEAIKRIRNVHNLAGFRQSQKFIAHLLRQLVNLWLILEHPLAREELADSASSDTMELQTLSTVERGGPIQEDLLHGIGLQMKIR